ncbi:MAG: isoprenylcysteine carboxylmethyltransferase family protein [Anaerolineales bacterium]|nr:isoprenylcysteine carboxylmethyltransferase family protein [Anaerolineales bacterium]
MKEESKPAQHDSSLKPERIIIHWIIRTIFGAAILGGLLFWTAGRVDWLMGWVYIVSLLLVGILSDIIVDPGLLAERSNRRHGNQKSWDKILFAFYGTLTGFLVPLLAALDMRFKWKPDLPGWLVMLALGIYLVGWGTNLWAMVANKYFAQVVRIQDDRGQTVMTGGPYRYLRHPGYAGGIMLSAAMPLVLESAWALALGIPAALLLLLRTILEDRMLQDELEGYRTYAQEVPYRLLPFLW